MPRLVSLLPLWLALFFSAGLWRIAAQTVVTSDPFKNPAAGTTDAVPPAPADCILDEANLFTAEERKEFSLRLLKLQREQGFHIYVAAYTFIYGEDANQRAVRLGRAWLPDKYGAVVVYDKGDKSDTGTGLGFASTQEETRFLTIPMLRGMIERANAAALAKKSEPPLKRVMAACEQLRIEFLAVKPMLDENRKIVSTRQWQIYGLVLGVMAVCLLLLLLAQRFQRRSDRKSTEKYLFPDVEISPRYGAPHAGGVTAHIDFNK